MCPNRPQADGQMSTGCPVGCPDTYDSIYMPPQCTAMIPDSEIDEKLKQTPIATDYCGHIEDLNIIIGISMCLTIAVCVECLIGKQKKPILFKVTEPSSVPYRAPPACVCVECLMGKQKKPILFKVTEPSSIPYRAPPACAKMAAYPDPPSRLCAVV